MDTNTPERVWQPAYSKVKILWWDCSVGFICICGKQEFAVDDDNSFERKCLECGRVYRLDTTLLVGEEPSNGR